MKKHKKRRRAWIALLLLVPVIAGILAWPGLRRWGMEFAYPLEHEDIIRRYSEQHGLDPFLVKGVIFTESGFRAEVVSPAGAIGLMQIMPATGQWLAERMGIDFDESYLADPAYNIRMGTFYLRELQQQFLVMDTALAAYNAGRGNVSNWLQQPEFSADGETLHDMPFLETRNYVERVHRYTAIYRELYGE